MANKPLNTELVDRAVAFALKAHAGTERRGKGFPYIIHPMEAMSIVATITKDPELLSAAVLHDTVEDTDVTVDMIRQEFGDRIADIVENETDKLFEGVSEEKSWHARKKLAIDRIAKSSMDSKIVAIGDKLSNMRAIARDYDTIGDNLWNIFHTKDKAEHEWHYRGLADSLKELSDTFAYDEFVTLINHVFPVSDNVELPATISLDDYVQKGGGYTSLTYDHKAENTMIKLYSNFVPNTVPFNEKRVCGIISGMGVRTPMVRRIVTDGSRIGVEFDRIVNKKSFSRMMADDPGCIEEVTVRFAKMCKELHSTPCDTTMFPNAKKYNAEMIMSNPLFSPEEKVIAKRFVDSVPSACACLHGDMHFGNVISDGKEDYWIDLGEFRYGNPLFDVGMMYFACKLTPEDKMQYIYHLSPCQGEEIWKVFVREYFDGKLSLEEADVLCAPYAALRMAYFSTRQKMDDKILNFIRGTLLNNCQ